MKKTVSLILVIWTLLLTACSAENPGSETTEAAATLPPVPGVTTAVSTDTERLTPNIGSVNFGGHVFNVLTRGTSSATWYSRDIFAESITGDIIGDAVYTRNTRMEEKYGFKVAEKGSKTPAAAAAASIGSGNDEYDMFCFKIKDDITGLILKGFLNNLNGVSAMNLDRPYYDQNSRKAFSIAGRLFLVTGDMLTMDNDATRCVLFNKALFKEAKIENEVGGTFYGLMDRGLWTLDAMEKAALVVTSDLNGDGVMDLSDRWGVASSAFNALALYNASGKLMFEKDADDIPYFTAGTEGSLEAFSRAITFLNSNFCRHYTDAYTEGIPQFKEGTLLFYSAQLADVPLLRGMEFDFGIIPLPKFSADQKSYFSTVTTYGSNCIAIPSSVQDTERAGSIIEVLSCESMYVLTPAYYDVSLKSKLIRDAESAPAIDIILSTACFELGYMWNWGSVYSTVTGAFNNNTPNLATSFRSSEKTANKAIANNVETIKAFEK
ncbi:MAG: extracellular solute-binding protein [Clostridia bacterium]|nr:extracellular solute-binding protein [Clostridia bacterium]